MIQVRQRVHVPLIYQCTLREMPQSAPVLARIAQLRSGFALHTSADQLR